jgi:hypothetical protein
MIISVFSTLGLQGNSFLLLKSWLVDFGASNHMTNSANTLHNIQPYTGSHSSQYSAIYKIITIANGNQLPIHDVGDVNSFV